ncbi:uncharacterized protein N7525_011124, partial [Penicillium rubens]|uniref:uncharacterized protein n=1 Tax=Penicillium rubens TaxID=1108849 RepID=UPI002A5ADD1D
PDNRSIVKESTEIEKPNKKLIVNIGECLIKRRSRDGIKEDIEAIRSIVTLLSDRLTYIGDPK